MTLNIFEKEKHLKKTLEKQKKLFESLEALDIDEDIKSKLALQICGLAAKVLGEG